MVLILKAHQDAGTMYYEATDEATGKTFAEATYTAGEIAPFIQVCDASGKRIFILNCPKGFGWYTSWGCAARTEITNSTLGLCGVLTAESGGLSRKSVYEVELVQKIARGYRVEQGVDGLRWLFDAGGKPAFVVEAPQIKASDPGFLKCYFTDAEWAYHAVLAAIWIDTKNKRGSYTAARPYLARARIVARAGGSRWNDEWERFYALCRSGEAVNVQFDVKYPHFLVG